MSFTSAFFFLIYFTFNSKDNLVNINVKDPSAASLIKRLESKKKALQDLREDSLTVLENFSNFTFTDNSITVYFPKYAVAPGSFGEQEISIPRTQ